MGCGTCSQCESGCSSSCQAIVPESPVPSPNPTVIFDGDCTFCRRWMRRYWNIKHDGIAFASYQNASSQYPAISDDAFRAALHVIEPDGTVRTGAGACWRVLQLTTLRSWPLWLHDHVPPVRWLGSLGYRWVTRHRGGMNTVSTLLHGNVAAPSTTLLTRRVFIRLLGLIYLAAFLSAGWQLDGLVGEAGIRPAGERLAMLESAFGGVPLNELPSLLWLDPSNAMLNGLWIAGASAAVLVCLGLLPMAMLGVCWVTYLSIVNGGDVFFNYQWDALLLEVGFLAIFWAPWHWRLNAPQVRRPSVVIRFLLLWLLARFMFFSGYVKLQSGDGTWTELTALTYHYWTQPLPVWTAWFMDQLPLWFQKTSCVIMFVIELGLPLLVFGPRVIRTIAFIGLVALQLAIIATGNYGFFNLLTLVLCVVLLDDAQLLLLWSKRWRWNVQAGLRSTETAAQRFVNAVVAICILSLSTAVTLSQFTRTPVAPDLTEPLRGYRLVNAYGLFRSMTTTRPELRIEGSRDGTTWQPYTFIYKPGPLDRMPPFCLPNMPRLDWQMWFDGLYAERLADYPSMQQRMILPDLLRALADQRSPVLDLLENTPFTDEGGPRFLRWSLDQYRFSPPQERADTGHWWTSTRIHGSNPLPVSQLR